MMLFSRVQVAVVTVYFASLTVASAASPNDGQPRYPEFTEFEKAIPEGDGLTGREIYERFLQNRYRRSTQQMRVLSMDPGGSAQTTAFSISLEETRDENDEPINGVLAKMLIEVSAPRDMRNTSYLFIYKDPGPDDEFIYQPSAKRVRRVDLKRTALMGTDYTFDDIAYHDIDRAEYQRLPDSVIDGTPVYVVESNIEDTRDAAYHKTVSYLEKEHYVPLRVRYWDDHDLEVKEMTAPAEKIRVFGGVWIPTESTMIDLMQQTSSKLLVDTVDFEPNFPTNLFGISRLTAGH